MTRALGECINIRRTYAFTVYYVYMMHGNYIIIKHHNFYAVYTHILHVIYVGYVKRITMHSTPLTNDT